MENFENFKFRPVKREEVESMLTQYGQQGNNSLIRWNHGMWIRFGNYDNDNLPLAMLVKGNIVGLVFYCILKNHIVNQYEIIVREGVTHEKYGEYLWRYWIEYVSLQGAKYLKISCTPQSIKWHYKHGLIFWGIDSSGSLRSFQPLFPTVEEQCRWRDYVIKHPDYKILSPKIAQFYLNEMLKDRKWSKEKINKIKDSILYIDKAWFYSRLQGEIQ